MRCFLLIAFGILLAGRPAWGQIIITPRPLPAPPRPAGIILPPVLPAGAPVVQPVPRIVVNPLWYGGYLPWYPQWEQPAPTVVNNFIPVPVLVPTAPAPQPVVEKKARLQLNIPRRSQVWINEKPVDVAAVPLLLESPDLKEGQSYTFDVKVVWQEGAQREERKRTVTVPVGEQRSLTYLASK